VSNWHLCGQVNVRVEFQWVFVPNTLLLEKATGLASCPQAVAKSIRELHLDSTLPGQGWERDTLLKGGVVSGSIAGFFS